MTDESHLAWDNEQEAIRAAIVSLTAFYERMPDAVQAAAKNRVAMALDSLETAADQLAAARTRYAQAMQDNPKEA